jgi:hypothetical protein
MLIKISTDTIIYESFIAENLHDFEVNIWLWRNKAENII